MHPPPPHFFPVPVAPVIVLANGDFPVHPLPLFLLEQAQTIICCDGAAQKVTAYGKEPNYIIGDMDSLAPELLKRFQARIIPSSCQETNDLTKAVRLCIQKGFPHIHILGATGGREDHTIANISLLADYALSLQVEMITDHGIFIPLLQPGQIRTRPGMQLSIFSLDPELSLHATGLKYPVQNVRFDSWWKGSLNEATGTECVFDFTAGRLLVFLSYAHSGLVGNPCVSWVFARRHGQWYRIQRCRWLLPEYWWASWYGVPKKGDYFDSVRYWPQIDNHITLGTATPILPSARLRQK